jgi:hypothetical protein
MGDRRHACSLTDEELLLLDGKAGAEIQERIDRVKRALALSAEQDMDLAEARFIADALAEAEKMGRLVFERRRLRQCAYSGESAGYARYARSSRYHRRGDINPEKPLFLPGVELASRFIRVEGHAVVGCSWRFWERVGPKLAARLGGVKAEIPEEISGRPPAWKWHPRKECGACGWKGHEGEMGLVPTVVGSGYYPGRCPSCGVENGIFSNIVRAVPGFELRPAKDKKEQEDGNGSDDQ